MNTNIPMESFSEALLEQLNVIESSTAEEKKKVEDCLSASYHSLRQLRQCVETNGFSNDEEEIHFFKYIKPLVKSRCIYYGRLQQLLNSYKNTCAQWRQEQLAGLQEKIGQYFSENRGLYEYYRSKHTSLDTVYFLRKGYDLQLCHWEYHYDPVFSSGADGPIAEMMAFESLLQYIENDRRSSLQSTIDHETPEVLPALKCTVAIVHIVELGYALYAAHVFNHGHATIKEVMQFLEKVFQVNLSNYYHTFHQIKERKNNPARFMDELKHSLLRYIDEEYSNVSKK